MSDFEQRKHARLDIAISVSYTVGNEAGEPSEAAESISSDISAGGLRLMTTAPLENGAVLNLEIRLPDEHEAPIKAIGEVVWQNQISNHSYETGTVIRSMDVTDKKRFMAFVMDQMSQLVGTSNNPNSVLH